MRARRGTVRPDMPWVETEEDPEFMEYIQTFPQQQRPKILELREKYGEKPWVVLRSRGQMDAYLRGLDAGMAEAKREQR